MLFIYLLLKEKGEFYKRSVGWIGLKVKTLKRKPIEGKKTSNFYLKSFDSVDQKTFLSLFIFLKWA